MKTTNWCRITLGAAFMGLVLFTATACVMKLSDADKIVSPKDGQKVSANEVKKVDLINGIADQSNWQTYNHPLFTFRYPQGWNVSLNAEGVGQNENYYLRVKSTDKVIVAGGAAPADYYREVDGKNEVNADKYAENYTAMIVDIYGGYADKSWDEFFNAVYPGVIVAHENFSIPVLPELEARQAVRVSGVYYGEPRFFVKKNGRVYDIALFENGMNRDEAQKTFNAFLKSFPF